MKTYEELIEKIKEMNAITGEEINSWSMYEVGWKDGYRACLFWASENNDRELIHEVFDNIVHSSEGTTK